MLHYVNENFLILDGLHYWNMVFLENELDKK